jgi:hypothetical protein
MKRSCELVPPGWMIDITVSTRIYLLSCIRAPPCGKVLILIATLSGDASSTLLKYFLYAEILSS